MPKMRMMFIMLMNLMANIGDGRITVDDTTLILYHVPENKPLTFTGLYNTQPSTAVINAYETKECQQGRRLAIIK